MPYRLYRPERMEVSISLPLREAIEIFSPERIIPFLYFDEFTIEAIALFYIDEIQGENRTEIIEKIKSVASLLNAEKGGYTTVLSEIANGTYILS